MVQVFDHETLAQLQDAHASRRTVLFENIQEDEADSDFQDPFEHDNYGEPLDPDDFEVDRGWWHRCRHCELSTRVTTRVPRCRHCGIKQTT